MANITAAMVSELRARTSVGMMDCKKALVECDGDMERACDYLREKGLAKAAKKAERTAAQGRMFTYVHSNREARRPPRARLRDRLRRPHR